MNQDDLIRGFVEKLYSDQNFLGAFYSTINDPIQMKTFLKNYGFSKIPHGSELWPKILMEGIKFGINPAYHPIGEIHAAMTMWAQEGKW